MFEFIGADHCAEIKTFIGTVFKVRLPKGVVALPRCAFFDTYISPNQRLLNEVAVPSKFPYVLKVEDGDADGHNVLTS